MLKEFLSQKGVPFQEFDVSQDSRAAHDMISRTGQRGVPVAIIDGEVVVGFDKPMLERLLGKRTQPTQQFGAAIADADKIAGRGLTIINGAYIGRIKSNSVAERLGLAPGDIVIEINERHIMNASDMESILHRLNTGSRLSIIFLRNNQTLTVEGIY
jgi:glutaredoxin 3